MAARWHFSMYTVVLLPHSKKVLGFASQLWQGLSLWCVHVLPVLSWCSSECSGFPHHQNMYLGLILQSVLLNKAMPKIWSWSLGAVCWLLTAPWVLVRSHYVAQFMIVSDKIMILLLLTPLQIVGPGCVSSVPCQHLGAATLGHFLGTQGACRFFYFAPKWTGWMHWGGHRGPPESRTWSSGGSTSRCPARYRSAPSPVPTSSRHPVVSWPLFCLLALPPLKHAPPAPASVPSSCWQCRNGSMLSLRVQLFQSPHTQEEPRASADLILP